MNNTWSFYTDPPPGWDTMCQAQDSIFHTTAWQTLITKTFRSNPLFCIGQVNESSQKRMALTIFPAGPFRIGYTGFPAGGLAGAQPLTIDMAHNLLIADFPISVHLLRIVVSPFPELISLPFPYAETYETTIPTLSGWHEKNLPSSLRRNLRKARKCNVKIKIADKSAAMAIFHLYKDTIRRHGGMMRYNHAYFRGLLELAQETFEICVWIAEINGEVAAFVAAAKEGATVYYLHGAVDRTKQIDRPGDLLFYTAINWAKELGATQFNMMASPIDQPSLVRYKEKWGGITAIQRTYTLPIRRIPAMGFRIANKLMVEWSIWRKKIKKFVLHF